MGPTAQTFVNRFASLPGHCRYSIVETKISLASFRRSLVFASSGQHAVESEMAAIQLVETAKAPNLKQVRGLLRSQLRLGPGIAR